MTISQIVAKYRSEGLIRVAPPIISYMGRGPGRPRVLTDEQRREHRQAHQIRWQEIRRARNKVKRLLAEAAFEALSPQQRNRIVMRKRRTRK